MRNTSTLKGIARSSILAFILMMAFTISGFAQMYIVGLDNDWNNFQSMKYSNDWDVYTFTFKPSEDGWFSWKFTEEANFEGRQWVNESNAAITFGAPIDWEFRTTYPDDPPAYGAWLIQDKYYTIVMNNPYADANIEGYVFESLTAPISSVSDIDLNPKPYNVTASDDVVVTLTANKAPNSNETVYVYTNGTFGEELYPFTFVDNIGTAIIPAKPEGTSVGYGIVSSFVSPPVNYYDYFLISEWGTGDWGYGVQDPAAAPIPYFSHERVADIAVDVNPTITFDKDVYKIGIDPLESFSVDEDVTAMITMRETFTSAPVAFSATINGRVITIVPGADLANSTRYSYSLESGVVQNATGETNSGHSRWFETIAPSVDVVFTVDMNYEVYVNGWDPVTGNVTVRGSWDESWAAPITMTDVDGDNVFEGILPNRFGGEEIQYKFVKDGDDWETIDNRSFTVDLSTPDVPLAYFNDNILPVESEMLSFTMAEQAGDATINSVDKTIALEVLYGTSLTELIPEFTLSLGATADVVSGVARDFSSEVTYSVTPYDNSAATDWTVNVTVLDAPLTGNDITSFSFAEQTGAATIDTEAGTVSIEVAYDADITNLTPAITISVGATIDPPADQADFSNPVVYTVTAQDESQKEWTVTVTIQETINVNLSVNMNKQFNMGEFDPATDGVSIAGNFNDWSDEAIFDIESDLIYTFTKAVPVGYEFDFKFQMLKDGSTIWENMADNRSYTVIEGVNAETVWFNNTPFSSDATLSGITVNGDQILGFMPSQLEYHYPLPAGSAVPVVLGTTNSEYADTLTTQAAAHPGIATIEVTAEDGTQVVYTINLVVGASQNATLSNLTLDGTTIEDFAANKFEYWVTLPYGTTLVPEVLGTAADLNATVDINQAMSLPGSATVEVTAEDDINFRIYTIYFSVALNDDATLSSLDLDFVPWDEFEAGKFEYIMPLPVGTYPPQVTGHTTTDPVALAIYDNAFTVPGIAEITVTAANFETQKSYKIYFTSEDASTDATLSDLTVDGVTIEGFGANVFEYNLVLPYGTTAIPVVNGTATTDVLANVSVTDATQLPGAATIKVTAEDGATQLLYTIHFTIAPHTDATLSDLTVDGVTIDGFDADLLNYSVELAYGTTLVPEVLGTATDGNAEVENTQAALLPGAATVKVTAEDGVTELTYTVNFTITPHTDATLSDLTVDGVTIEDFDASTMVYAMELPYGTTSVEVLGTATDVNAEVENTQAAVLPGAATVKVTAEDGVTELTYTVNFTIAPNTDATLSDLTVDGVTVDEFTADLYSYSVELAYGTTSVEVLGTATDGNAEVENTQATVLPGAATVKVTAEDGVTELTYTVNFTIAPNTDATLSDLTVDGVTVDEFNADLFSYSVELPYGTISVPEVLGTATDGNAEVENTQAAVLPGAATVKVTAEDGVTELTYTVNFTIAPNTDATLSDLTVDGVTVDEFNADLYSYSVELPYGTTSVEVLGTATDGNAEVENTQATEFPGAATVKVTAEDGVTELTYTVTFTIATGINNTESIISNVYPNPTKGMVTIQLSNLNTETKLRVTDISGRIIMVKSLSQLESQVDLSSNKPGIYIISVSNSDKLYHTRIILQ